MHCPITLTNIFTTMKALPHQCRDAVSSLAMRVWEAVKSIFHKIFGEKHVSPAPISSAEVHLAAPTHESSPPVATTEPRVVEERTEEIPLTGRSAAFSDVLPPDQDTCTFPLNSARDQASGHVQSPETVETTEENIHPSPVQMLMSLFSRK